MAKPRPRLTPEQKRKRRQRRMITVVSYVLLAIVLAWFLEMRATTTIMFVRHADTDVTDELSDPALNAVGRERAELLAEFLADVDVLASVDAIYASEFQRTQQTAAPLADRIGVEIALEDHYDVVGFMERVLDAHKGQIVLVVTHGDILGDLVAELHGHQSVPEIGPDDYDDVYIVSIPHFGKVKTLRLPYAVGWQPPKAGPMQSGGLVTQPELGAR